MSASGSGELRCTVKVGKGASLPWPKTPRFAPTTSESRRESAGNYVLGAHSFHQHGVHRPELIMGARGGGSHSIVLAYIVSV